LAEAEVYEGGPEDGDAGAGEGDADFEGGEEDGGRCVPGHVVAGCRSGVFGEHVDTGAGEGTGAWERLVGEYRSKGWNGRPVSGYVGDTYTAPKKNTPIIPQI